MFLYELLNFAKNKIVCKNVYVVPCDMLPTQFQLPAGFIINCSPAKTAGSHWVALWINSEGTAYYFDSYGFKPNVRDIRLFIRMHSKKLIYNKRQLQQLHSIVCGQWAASFLYHISDGIENADNFIKLFGHNLLINDIIIERLFKKLCL